MFGETARCWIPENRGRNHHDAAEKGPTKMENPPAGTAVGLQEVREGVAVVLYRKIHIYGSVQDGAEGR